MSQKYKINNIAAPWSLKSGKGGMFVKLEGRKYHNFEIYKLTYFMETISALAFFNLVQLETRKPLISSTRIRIYKYFV